VSPDDIKGLRKKLACTAKELAGALGVDQATVLAWERAALFPTKIYVDRMAELLAKGPSAIPRRVGKSSSAREGSDPLRVLADPQVWDLVRKIATNKKFRDEVAKLAESYPDPTTE
jgi:transcriptional regulator with XRE-family HTH domain